MLMLMWITALNIYKIDSAQESKFINQPDSMVVADVGDSVTLRCFRPEEETSGSIIWYKQKIGHEPCTMATVDYEPIWDNQFKSPRFSIKKEERGFHLNIANIEPSDEAMYYCSLMKFSPVYGKGTFLTVKGNEDVKVSVWQSDVSDTVPAGASVTLQCSVLSERRAAELQVLWFRAAPPQSHPQIIYTHHNSSHQCESGSSTHTCVYNFTKNIHSLSDTGTYYCAVALCGKVTFGNGTQVQLDVKTLTDQCFKGSVVICLAVALAVCVVINCAQAVLYYKKRCTVKHSQDKIHFQDCETVEVNYAAINFSEKKNKSGRAKRAELQNPVYSQVLHIPVT